MRNLTLLLFLFFGGMMRVLGNEETPDYLYKILSYRNWLATECRKVVILSGDDQEFVHFSTKEQVDRIVGKYWSNADQYVVLKVETSRLQGNLKFEPNPGSSNKYYHLYDGFIPVDAIAEANIVFRERMASAQQEHLSIVKLGDPVLRQPARPLTKKEILSPEIQGLIAEMKATMRAAPGVGLAAPQIGKGIQLIVVEDMDQSHLTPEQIRERERGKVPFHVVINPKIAVEGTETASFFEGCLSVPIYLGVVPRAKAVRVDCLNERGEPVVIHAKGWYARILQHETDHLNGTLCIDRAIKQTLMTEENYMKLWNGKPIKEICDCLIP